jgi:hypothetical protein
MAGSIGLGAGQDRVAGDMEGRRLAWVFPVMATGQRLDQ